MIPSSVFVSFAKAPPDLVGIRGREVDGGFDRLREVEAV